MNIGIDIDDTITCTSETIEKYSKKYAIENKIRENDLWDIPENKIKFLEKISRRNIYKYSAKRKCSRKF